MAETPLMSERSGAAAPSGADTPPPALDPAATARLAQVDPAWAWAAYAPAPDRPWNQTLAAHLYRRAGFGANASELERAQTRGPAAAVNELLNPAEAAKAFNATADDYEAAAARSGDAASLTAWWLRRLVETPDPLGEKLALFWHNHFAIGAAAVAHLPNFHRHVRWLRHSAREDFAALFRGLLDDPAMYAALGGEQNRRAQPNLHFARAWLEAFTVGPAIASDHDVTQTARCFTGWFVYGGKLRFIDHERDAGDKTILGRTGAFARDDLVELLPGHPATTRHLARKLFRWFVADSVSPSDRLLEPITAKLRQPGGTRSAVELMLRSNLFFSEHALLQKIKSPVELVVGLARSLETTPPTLPIARDLVNLGQPLDEPPTVRGWMGGTHWINTITLAARLRLCHSLLEGSGDYGQGSDPSAVAERRVKGGARAAAQFWLDVLAQDQLSPATRDQILRLAEGSSPIRARLRAVVAAIVSQPEYQMC